MALVDTARLHVVGGVGGSGCTSFRREKYVAKGGPDGGDGGDGGSVFVKVDPQLSTLLDYRYRMHWKAERGRHGEGSNRKGKSGEDRFLPVPPGTEVRDGDTGQLLGELLEPAQQLCVAKGGRGGRGNAAFATPTHRAPREWEPGEEGEDRHIELILKLIADVGLLGEPNAGKSTLLSVLSAARPKIADYPFTTLEPNLGVVGLSGARSFVLADVPGIIAGAHSGKGLGDKFLQHVERTRVLVYLVPLDSEDPQASFEMIRKEAQAYGAALAAKPFIVALTKSDVMASDEDAPRIETPGAEDVVVISAAANRGLDELAESVWKLLARTTEAPQDRAVPLP
jgi:GTP-binding protein